MPFSEQSEAATTQVSNHRRFQPITDKITSEAPTYTPRNNKSVTSMRHPQQPRSLIEVGGQSHNLATLSPSKRPGTHRKRSEPERIRNKQSTPLASQSFITNAQGQHTTSPPPLHGAQSFRS